MTKRKMINKAAKIVTDQAKAWCKKHPGWQIVTAEQCCREFERLRDGGWTLLGMADRMNEKQRCRGNLRNGDAKWTPSDVSMLYRSCTGYSLMSQKPAKLGGGKKKTSTKKSKKAPKAKGTSKKKSGKKTTKKSNGQTAAQEFVKAHPSWEIWSGKKISQFVQRKQKEEKWTMANCAEALNNSKILRDNYQTGSSPKISSTLLRRICQLNGVKPAKNVRSVKPRKPRKKTTKKVPAKKASTGMIVIVNGRVVTGEQAVKLVRGILG